MLLSILFRSQTLSLPLGHPKYGGFSTNDIPLVPIILVSLINSHTNKNIQFFLCKSSIFYAHLYILLHYLNLIYSHTNSAVLFAPLEFSQTVLSNLSKSSFKPFSAKPPTSTSTSLKPIFFNIFMLA